MSNEHEPSDSQSREHEQEFLMEITGPRSSEVEENEGKASAMIYCLHNGIPVSNVEILELPSTKQELLVFLSAGLAEGRKITDLRVYKVNDFYTDNRDINMNEVDQDREEILDDFDIEEEGIYECHLTIVDAPKKRPFDEVQKMTEEPKLCEICRGEIDDPTHLCSDDNHPLFCANCIQAYLENKVTSSFMGSCPIMFCPSAFHQNRRKIIPYNQWIVHVPTTIARQFTTLATSLLKFQCSSCHIPSTLDLGFEANRSALCYKQLEKMLIDNFGTSNKFSEVEKHVQEYCEGDLSLEEIYSFFYEVFPRLVNATDEEAWDTFSMILRIVSDPERRCNLHLRYLRDHPRIKTLCCNREHCFRCKTKGFHNGRSCVETTEMLDHSVVTCPSCSIALARGDGCDTLTCLCGKQFSWTNEKRINERCNEFIRLFGDNSLSNCVMVLCDHRDNWEEVIRQGAKAYQNRNRIEVNRALTDWFKKKYWPCPSQCCTVLVPETLADGVKEAIELWKNTHAAEVNKRKEENDIALRSVFLNMVKDEHERPVVAHRLMNPSRRSLLGNVDDKMVQSAIKWVEKNRERYNRGVEEYEERSARQFLFLFGKKSVSSVVAYDFDFPQVLYWSLDISNRYLTYTNDGSAVKREGNASSRPAVNARIGNSRATIRIFMEETTHTPSLLAIGLTRQPMPVSDGEGIGMRRDSWGLLQDSAASSNYCTIMECGKSVEKIRKIVKGDTVSLSVDVIEGWCELVINEVDYKHLFKIPTTGNPDEYYFAANIAVNHKLSLVIDNTSSKGALSEFEANESHKQPTPGKLTKLNECHTAMYHTFKKFVRKMMQDCLDDEENETVQISTSSANSLTSGLKYPIETSGDEWLKMWNNDSKLAFERFQIIQPSILSFLGLNTNRYLRKHSSSRKDESTALTFETLLEAVSWFNHHQNQIKSELRTEMGLNFMVMHGPNAPFIAASNMAEYYTHRVDSDDRLASLAYMHIFPEEMNAWYEYNEVMSDPIVPNVARGCRCLPRHIRTCPNIRRNYA